VRAFRLRSRSTHTLSSGFFFLQEFAFRSVSFHFISTVQGGSTPLSVGGLAKRMHFPQSSSFPLYSTVYFRSRIFQLGNGSSREGTLLHPSILWLDRRDRTSFFPPFSVVALEVRLPIVFSSALGPPFSQDSIPFPSLPLPRARRD